MLTHTYICAISYLAIAALGVEIASAQSAPGVTMTEIRFGQTTALSGPASAYSVTARTEAAYFKMINEQGGINRRKLNFISVDDAYSAPKTVEQTRRLVEQEGVAFMFNGTGTAPQLAVRSYLNEGKIPQLFAGFGITEEQKYPWTLPFFQNYFTEAGIYARYTLTALSHAKVAILYQDDELGRSYLKGFANGLGPEHHDMIVRSEPYNLAEATVDSQIISLQSSGADVLFIAATPKFAAQAIRKASDLGWQPTRFIAFVSSTISSVLKPAGLVNSTGVITATPFKDVTDPEWREDADVKAYVAFAEKYLTSNEASNNAAAYGYMAAALLVHVLGECGDDLSRENIMRQATHLSDVTVPLTLPGVKIDTSPTNYRVLRQLQLQRFDGEHWRRFGKLMSD